MQWIYDLVNFFFPLYCPVCGIPVTLRKQKLCLQCELDMPRAGFPDPRDNPVAQLFWGRVRVAAATSFFRFEKGSRYQKLLHILKYNGDQAMGLYLGKLLGSELKDSVFGQCDYLVPVPLHEQKMRKRGYNQSEIIANGVSIVTGIPVRIDLLFRDGVTSTQTRKSRFERFKNVEKVFRFESGNLESSGCSILLLDDVVTTGSTLEACASALLEKKGIKVYVATVACA